ncbi:Protein of unknown function [Melghirimyces algeriensis]|uniref:Uncharacterized protein n=1 Tax=Melghirimyces algeriensis TaxID=910412 RepID=A0A521CWG6_9BACL|nr:Protein of unknown function [Melghirimyces algeriensis]
MNLQTVCPDLFDEFTAVGRWRSRNERFHAFVATVRGVLSQTGCYMKGTWNMKVCTQSGAFLCFYSKKIYNNHFLPLKNIVNYEQRREAYLKLLHHFLKVLHRKKGSPTVEYVMIIVAGALLASILVNVANSETVKEELQQAIACKFSTIMVDENGNPACKDPNIVKEKPNTSLSESNSHIVLKPVSKPLSKPDSKPKNEEKGFFDQLGDGLSSTWNGFKKDAKEFVEDPWGKTKEVAGDVWEGTKEVASDTWEWTKEHKEEIAAGLTVAAGVGLLFVPGAQAFGAGILIGAAVGGGISAVQGNDFKTIMADTAIGGLAGAVGGGVTGGVIRGVGRYIGRRATQLLGNSVGASTGSLADDFLRGKTFNWKNAAVAGLLAFGITHGVQVAKTTAPVFGFTPKANQATTKVEKVGLVYRGLKESKIYSPAEF